ncbi:50S ribosomal protein L25 [Chloroflexia bacterium SDU3-3]|nr:50S ribosomal protein L25 [Chloroflexia bacterium SDU3-3]
MAETFKLEFETRTLFGKKVNRLRREGILPATVYGKNIGPFAVQINGRTFSDLVRKSGKTGLIEVSIPGQPVRTALVHAVQRHPVSREFIHADLLIVDLKTAITVDVPVHLIGESPVVKNEGAVLNHTLSTVSVHALPTEIPSHIEVDVSVLDSLDKNILVSDIKLPGEATIVTAADEVVASVTPATVETAPSDEAPAEPELVREDRGADAE